MEYLNKIPIGHKAIRINVYEEPETIKLILDDVAYVYEMKRIRWGWTVVLRSDKVSGAE